MPEQTGQFFFPNPWDQVFDAIVEAARRARMNVKAWDKPSGFIQLEVSLNFWSWGEDVPIQLSEAGPGQTWATIASSSKFALVDWGKNRRNIEKLMSQVSAVLAEMGQAPVYQPPADQPEQAQPAAEPQQAAPEAEAETGTGRKCWRCRAPLPAEAKFCSRCGAGLPG